MDISLREWLIILGVLIIIVVILDGIRRARRARQDSMEISQGMGGNFESTPLDDDFNPELPGTGFRVVRKGMDSRDEMPNSDHSRDEMESSDHSRDEMDSRDEIDSSDYSRDQWDDERLDEHADIEESGYSEPAYQSPYAEVDDKFAGEYNARITGARSGGERENHLNSHDESYATVGSEKPRDNLAEVDDFDGEPMRAEPRWDDEDELVEPFTTSLKDPISAVEDMVEADLKNNVRTADIQAEVEDRPHVHKSHEKAIDFKDRFLKKITANVDAIQDSLQSKQPKSHKQHKPVYKSAKQKRRSEKAAKELQEEIIVVNVLAKSPEGFEGMKLRHLVEACGMQLGDMSIYHRHEYDFDQGPVQFSMANAVKPGIFGRDMDESMTPGVSFFMRLPGPDDSMQAFDYMIETAQCLVRNLGGELKDEYLSVMTQQTVEHCRQRVREFERKQQLSSKV